MHLKMLGPLSDLFDIILVAMLITGGYGGDAAGVELFLPSAGTSCVLPSLPDLRKGHTMDNNIICGGTDTEDSCLKWWSTDTGTGSWKRLLTLDIKRNQHVTWTPEHSRRTYLMGGKHSPKTSTLIKNDGTQEPAFQLEYSTV